jgi:hypothetical protein
MGNAKKQIKEKPLDKMTAKELRDIAQGLPDITGAHGMNKSELISAIKKAKGIEDTSPKKGSDATVRQIKAKIQELKKQRVEYKAQNNKKMTEVFRRRINRLKKQTRKA